MEADAGSSPETYLPPLPAQAAMKMGPGNRATAEKAGPSLLSTSQDLGPPSSPMDRAGAMFRAYDSEGRNWLDRADTVGALAELGLLQGVSAKALAEVLGLDSIGVREKKFVMQDFLEVADRLTAHQNKLAREGRIKAQSLLAEPPAGAERDPALRQCFVNYCRYTVGVSRMITNDNQADPRMNAAQLMKLACDLSLVGDHGPLPSVSVDIIFAKVKPPGGRKLNFHNFLRALAALSEESKQDLFQAISTLGSYLSPPSRDRMSPPRGSSRGAVNGVLLPRIEATDDLDRKPKFNPKGAVYRNLGMRDAPGSPNSSKQVKVSGVRSVPVQYNNYMGSRRSLEGTPDSNMYGLGDVPPWLGHVLERLATLENHFDLTAQHPELSLLDLSHMVEQMDKRLKGVEKAGAPADAAAARTSDPGNQQALQTLQSQVGKLQARLVAVEEAAARSEGQAQSLQELQAQLAALSEQMEAMQADAKGATARLMAVEASASIAMAAASANAGRSGGSGEASSVAVATLEAKLDAALAQSNAQLAEARQQLLLVEAKMEALGKSTAAAATAEVTASLAVQISGLDKKLEDVSSQAASHAAAAATSAELEALRAELTTAMASQVQSVQSDVAGLREQVASTSQQLPQAVADLEAKLQPLQQGVASTSEAIANLQQSMAAHSEAFASLQQAVAGSGEAITNLHQSAAASNEAIAKLQQGSASTSEATAKLQQQVDSLQAAQSGLAAAAQAAASGVDAATAQQIGQLSTRLEQFEQQVKALDGKVDGRLGVLESKLDGQLSSLSSRLQTLQDEQDKAAVATAAAAQAATAAASGAQAASLALGQMQERIVAVDGRVTASESAAASAAQGSQQAVAGLQKELEVVKGQTAQVESLKGQVDALKGQVAPIDALKAQVAQLSEATASSAAAAAAAASGVDAATAQQIGQLSGKLSQLEQQASTASDANAKLQQAVAELGTRLAAADRSQAVEQLQQQLQELQQAVSQAQAESKSAAAAAEAAKTVASAAAAVSASSSVTSSRPVTPAKDGTVSMTQQVIDKLNEQIMGVDQRVVALAAVQKTTVEGTQEALKTLRQQVSELQQGAATAAGSSQAEAARVTQLQQDMASVQVRLQSLASEHAAAAAAAAGATSAQQVEASVAAKLAGLQEQLAGLSARVDGTGQAMTALAGSLDQKEDKQKVTGMEQLMATVAQRLAAAEANMGQVSGAIATTQSLEKRLLAVEREVLQKVPASPAPSALDTATLADLGDDVRALAMRVDQLASGQADISVKMRHQGPAGVQMADVQALLKDQLGPVNARISQIDQQAQTIMSALQEMAKGADMVKTTADGALHAAEAAQSAAMAAAAAAASNSGGGGGGMTPEERNALDTVNKTVMVIQRAMQILQSQFDEVRQHVEASAALQMVAPPSASGGATNGEAVEVLSRDIKTLQASMAKMSDLRELENHMLDRIEDLKAAVDAGLNRAKSFSSAAAARASASGADMLPPGSAMGKTATFEALKQMETLLSKADAQIRQDINTLDEKVAEHDEKLGKVEESVKQRLELSEKVLMKMARQMDFIQKKLQQEAAADNMASFTSTMSRR